MPGLILPSSAAPLLDATLVRAPSHKPHDAASHAAFPTLMEANRSSSATGVNRSDSSTISGNSLTPDLLLNAAALPSNPGSLPMLSKLGSDSRISTYGVPTAGSNLPTTAGFTGLHKTNALVLNLNSGARHSSTQRPITGKSSGSMSESRDLNVGNSVLGAGNLARTPEQVVLGATGQIAQQGMGFGLPNMILL